jgi:hypothetical protein
MWRFLKRPVIKERDFSPRHMDNSDDVSDEESQAFDKFHCTSATTDTRKVLLYNESYLSMGFTWAGDSSCPIPQWQTTYKVSNGSNKTEMTLTINHSHMTSKSADYFKWLLGSKKNRSKLLLLKSQSVNGPRRQVI